MGSDFFWFFDVILIAVIIINMFRGYRKGAVGVLISALAAIVAFLGAFVGSTALSGVIYDRFVDEPLNDYVNDKISIIINNNSIREASSNMSKAKVKGVYLPEIDIDFDSNNTAVLDLSSVDLSETNIEYADLSILGLHDDFDYTDAKVGNIIVTRSELAQYGINNIVLSHIVAVNLSSGDLFSAITSIGEKMSETLFTSVKDIGNELSTGNKDMIYKFMLPIIGFESTDVGKLVLDTIVKPVILTPMKVIIFLVLFALLMFLLNVIANATKIINRIPIVSSINQFFGVILGLAEAIIILLIICIVIKAAISLCGNSLVFINEAVIDKTFLFKYIYSFDPLQLVDSMKIQI